MLRDVVAGMVAEIRASAEPAAELAKAEPAARCRPRSRSCTSARRCGSPAPTRTSPTSPRRTSGRWAAGHAGVRLGLPRGRGLPGGKRPFYTHPQPDDPRWTNSFDILFRGLELCTGGQRLHRYEDYVAALTARGENVEPYAGYLEPFRHGMPPHGGFAIGLERWVARLAEAENIRAVTLFPRDLHRLTP